MSRHTIDRPLIECPICHQQMKRITPAHLKKHGMSMQEFREKHGDVSAKNDVQVLNLNDPEVMKDITGQVLRRIVSNEQLDDNARDVIQNLIQDQAANLRLSLNVAAIQRIGNLDSLFDTLNAIQGTLFSERRLAGMSDAALTKTYQIVEKSIENILDYLKSLSVKRDKQTSNLFEQTNVVNIFANDPSVPETPDSPAGREKIRALFTGLMQRMQDGSIKRAMETPAITVEPVSVEPVSVEVQEPVDEDATESPEAPDQEGAGGTSAAGIDVPG